MINKNEKINKRTDEHVLKNAQLQTYIYTFPNQQQQKKQTNATSL